MTRDEYVRECLSNDYPRLDIRIGKATAKPWEKPPAAVQGWVNEKGEIVPFEGRK